MGETRSTRLKLPLLSCDVEMKDKSSIFLSSPLPSFLPLFLPFFLFPHFLPFILSSSPPSEAVDFQERKKIAHQFQSNFLMSFAFWQSSNFNTRSMTRTSLFNCAFAQFYRVRLISRFEETSIPRFFFHFASLKFK